MKLGFWGSIRSQLKLGTVLANSAPPDTTAPTVTIGSSDSDPTIVSPITITFTWSEDVTGFAAGDVTIGNGTGVTFTAVDASHYTYTVVPNAGATVTIDVGAGVCVDAAGNSNTAATQYTVASKVLLWDDFTDTRAGGAVNETASTPGPGGNRVVTDTNSKLSIGSGVLSFATGGAGTANPRIHYPSVTRAAKLGYFQSITPANTNGQYTAGFDNDTANEIGNGHLFYTSGALYAMRNNGAFSVVGSYSATGYQLATILRATGEFTFIKGGTFTNWTLIYISKTGTAATLYPGISVYSGSTSVFTAGFVRAFNQALTMTPLASDAFTRANGSLGNTGGGGSEESGGSNVAWTVQLGTWGIATNKAACSALDGGTSVGVATVNAGTANVMVEVVMTRSSGSAGLCLRYTDSSNYIKAVHNGTNLQVIEVVSGTPNTLINSAVSYDGTVRTIISLNGTAVRAYYNENLIGAQATTAISSGNNHGLFTDDTGATFDNFVVWAKGNGGEYSTLDNYIANP